MKVAIVYIMPLCAGERYFDYALRFLQNYHEHPPGLAHDSVIVLNGGRANSDLTCLFSTMQNTHFIEHDNSGQDIGGFQRAAREYPCDLMVFFGASTYFKRAGWLLRMVNAFNTYGNGLYGAMGNRGNVACGVYPHIRTTAFWMPPDLLNQNGFRVTHSGQRYAWEHGQDCLTQWVHRRGLKARVVTWEMMTEPDNWDADPNGFHQGNQTSLLAGDRITEPPYYPIP